MKKDVLDSEDLSVSGEGDLGVVDLTAFMGGRDEVLFPIFDPFDRPLEGDRGPGNQHLFGVEHHDFGPETTTDKRRDHAHPGL